MAKKLSIVATSRNDNHGGDMTKRMRIFVNGLIHQCNKYNIDAELMMVEWNPLPGKPLLKDELPQPKAGDKLTVRYVVVPAELHNRYVHAKTIPLYQMIAKNVGIRRAEGEFVLCTNIDLLFSDELFEWLIQHPLEHGKYYRAPRADVPRDIDENWSVPQQLAWSKKNVIAKWGMDRRFLNMIGMPIWLWKFPFLPEVLDRLLGLLRRFRSSVDFKLSQTDFFACGDFTLMSKEDWEKIQGYAELDLYSIHIDSMALSACVAQGIEQEVLPYECCTYHIYHEEGWSSMNAMQVMQFLAKRPGMDWNVVYNASRYIIENKTNYGVNASDWGFANEQLQEFRFN